MKRCLLTAILIWSLNLSLLFLSANPALAGEWNIQTVDSVIWVGENTSIALDTNGYPHISYWDGTNGDLKHKRGGQTCCCRQRSTCFW